MSDKICDLTDELYKPLFSTGSVGKNLKNVTDVLLIKYLVSDIGYTGGGDKSSELNIILQKTLPQKLLKLKIELYCK